MGEPRPELTREEELELARVEVGARQARTGEGWRRLAAALGDAVSAETVRSWVRRGQLRNPLETEAQLQEERLAALGAAAQWEKRARRLEERLAKQGGPPDPPPTSSLELAMRRRLGKRRGPRTLAESQVSTFWRLTEDLGRFLDELSIALDRVPLPEPSRRALAALAWPLLRRASREGPLPALPAVPVMVALVEHEPDVLSVAGRLLLDVAGYSQEANILANAELLPELAQRQQARAIAERRLGPALREGGRLLAEGPEERRWLAVRPELAEQLAALELALEARGDPVADRGGVAAMALEEGLAVLRRRLGTEEGLAASPGEWEMEEPETQEQER